MKKAYWQAWPTLIGVLVVAILFLATEAMFSIQIMRTVDAAIDNNRLLFTQEAKMLIFWLALLFPGQLLLAFAKGFYKRQTVTKIKEHYLKGIFKQDIHAFHGENSAHHVSALTNDINIIETHYIDGLYEVVLNILSFIVGIAVIAYVSPFVLAVGVGLGVVSALLSSWMSKPVQKQHKQRSELFNGYTAAIKEVLSAFHIVKVNNLTGKVKKEFGEKSKHIQEKGYVIDKIFTIISAIQNILTQLVMIALIGFSVYMTIQGNMTFGGVVLVVSNMEKVMRPLMEIGEWMPKIASSKGLFDKLDQKLVVAIEHEEDLDINGFSSSIQIEDLSFAYDDQSVLNNVYYTFEKGKKYLVTGPSGGGKTTLLKLLRKYFLPTSGKMLIDGQPLEKITKDSYFHLIANIEQHVFLFEDTLRNNLSLYKPVSDAALIEALEKAGMKSFLEKNPEGLNYMIYDNGKNLSGGERSRIAIARGLLQDAQIIYLDEAFSSLDEKVAKEIEETLLALKDITVINVSHVVFDRTKHQYDAVLKVNGHIDVLIPA